MITAKLDLYDCTIVGNTIVMEADSLSDVTIADLASEIAQADQQVYLEGRYFEVNKFNINHTEDGRFFVVLDVQEEKDIYGKAVQ